MTAPDAPCCLWLARALPFPLDSGDRIYSAWLANALAEAGVRVTFVGHDAGAGAVVPASHAAVSWHAVGGGRRPTWLGLASLQPLNGAIHASPAYRHRLKRLLGRQAWDAVVLDHYGMAWALPDVVRHARRQARPPTLVHVAHNHETTLWQGLVRELGAPSLRRLGAWLNLQKIRRVERQLARSVDLLCCITDEDAAAFAQDRGADRTIVLTPGYSGLRMPDRMLTATVPRRVLMVGSYRWVAKQENLRALVRLADAPFTAHGIGLDIVGDVPDALRTQLAGHASVKLHGFVDDIAPLLRRARLAIVPELIGGGFKLKYLDYVFGRMPVVTLDTAAAGLPAPVRGAMLACADLPSLVQTVVARIDDLPLLDHMQRLAYASALPLFHWSDRGRALRSAMLPQR